MSSPDVYQENGISWNEAYTLNTIDSIKGSPIAVEFLDENKSEIWGHGITGEISTENGQMPIFTNSEVVGSFTGGYIDDVEINGVIKRVCVGNGLIYEQRYPAFTKWLIENVPNGNVMGSVEICGLPEYENKIVYDGDGYKEYGRVPKHYLYSAHALLSSLVKPADSAAKVLEINNKTENQNESEENILDEKVLNQFITDIKGVITETNSKNTEYETQINDLNNKITELNSTVEELTAKLTEAESAKTECDGKITELNSTIEQLNIDVEDGKKKEKIVELNTILADFTDDEKAFAADEIKAFEENPLESEINSVVSKIAVEIVKKAKEAQKVSETNAASNQTNVEDIFGDISETNSAKDSGSDDSIF